MALYVCSVGGMGKDRLRAPSRVCERSPAVLARESCAHSMTTGKLRARALARHRAHEIRPGREGALAHSACPCHPLSNAKHVHRVSHGKPVPPLPPSPVRGDTLLAPTRTARAWPAQSRMIQPTLLPPCTVRGPRPTRGTSRRTAQWPAFGNGRPVPRRRFQSWRGLACQGAARNRSQSVR